MKQISRFAKSVCSGCLSAAVLMLLSCTAAAAAPAKLEIPSSLDFGIVPQESVNTKTFSIKNPSDAGSGKVKIMVSCSCLEVKPETFELKAHSTADLTVTYRPRSSSGKASNRIYVQQAGSDTPDAVINVTAEVYKLFSSQPSKVDFGLVPIGSPRQSSFQLMALSDKTFRIDKAIFDQSLLDVKYEQQAVLSKQKPLPVSVALKNTVPVGDGSNDPTRALRTSIRFLMSDTETGASWRYSVTVSAKILGEVEVTPPKYSFIDQPRDARLSLKVQLKNRYGKPFRITGFSSFFGCTDAQFGKEPAASHEVELSIDASKVDGNVEDMLRFMTDLHIEKVIKMPVTILFKQQKQGE